MSQTIQIQLSPEALQVLANLASLPQRLGRAVARAMDQQNLLTVSHIQQKYLSFPKDRPTTLAGLRAVGTPGYRGTLRTSKAVVEGDTITSGIGSNITNKGFSYPALHEFGGSWITKSGSVKLRTNARGEDVKQASNPNLLRFAGAQHKRFRVQTFAGGKQVTMPARAPITHGIEDRAGDYGTALSAAIVRTWEEKS